MKKIAWFIIFILIVIAFGAGVWLKEDVLKVSENFQKIDIESVVAEAQKQILTATPLNVGGKSNDAILLKSKIIEETNKQRIANGLKALSENGLLDNTATAKANDMFKNQYFEHISPSGVNPGDLVLSFGYEYLLTGENLILGNFENETELVQDWMNSQGHRENILNAGYTEIGVSVIKGEFKGESVWIAVQEFGLPVSACAKPSQDLKNQIDLKQTEIDQLMNFISEKKSEIEKADRNSAYYNQMVSDYNDMIERYNLLSKEIKSIVEIYNAQVNGFNRCASNSILK
jgi:uncharacterized protein YkwD